MNMNEKNLVDFVEDVFEPIERADRLLNGIIDQYFANTTPTETNQTDFEFMQAVLNTVLFILHDTHGKCGKVIFK